MFEHHPTSEELGAFCATLAARRVAANTRVVRHLLAGCRRLPDRLDDMGWEASRLDKLLQLRAALPGTGRRARI